MATRTYTNTINFDHTNNTSTQRKQVVLRRDVHTLLDQPQNSILSKLLTLITILLLSFFFTTNLCAQPQITNVQVLSGGTQVRITYDLDQDYPTSGTHTPYAQLLRDEIEVDRIEGITATSGVHTLDMDATALNGWFQINLLLDPPGAGAGIGRKFFLNGSTVTLDFFHHQLIGESGVYAVPYTVMNPVCDVEEGGSDGGNGGGGPMGPNGGGGNCPTGANDPFDDPLCEIINEGGGGSVGAAYSLSYFIPSIVFVDLTNAVTRSASEDCGDCPPVSADGNGGDAAGCGSCGGGSDGGGIWFEMPSNLPDLNVAFRPHKVGQFGGGVSVGFELDPYGSNAHIYMSENTVPIVNLNETNGMPLVTFEDDLDSDPVDGVLYDQQGFYKKAELKDANGNTTSTLSSAETLVVTRHRGGTLEFELIDPIDGDPDTDQDARLTAIKDRNGHGSTITYTGGGFKINEVTDFHGNVLEFTYGANQLGQPAISSIEYPTGNIVNFTYNSDGLLSEISMDEGWECGFTYTPNQTTQTVVMAFTSSSLGERDYHLTQDYIELDGELLNQPLNILRGIDDPDGNNEVTFVPDTTDPQKVTIFQGDDKLSEQMVGESEKFATSFTTFGGGGGGGTLPPFISIIWETSYGQNDFLTQYTDQRWILGAPPRIIDASGNIIDQEFDSDWFLTKRTYGDSTFEEWTRNSFKQITRYRDRLGRVVKYEYDSAGNMTKKEVGILEVSGSDVNQTEFAEYKWDYYTSGVLEGLLKTAYSPLHTNETDMYRIDFEYYSTAPNIGRLHKVIESADVASGTRPTTTYAYDTHGNLQSITGPEGRVTTAVRDDLSRVVEIEYNDTSKDQVLYGASGSGKEGRIVKARNRVGVVTTTTYDDYGRVTEVLQAAATDANIRDGQADDTIISDAWRQSKTTYDYIDGTYQTNYVIRDGKKTAYEYDFRRRVKKTTRYPSLGETLISTKHYVDNDLFYTEDPYGRKKYMGYRASDGQLIRRIQGTSPSFSLTNNAAVLNKTRDLTNNAQYIVADAIRDAEGQLTEVIDGRGITTKTEFDSRGRSIRTLAAYGKSIETKMEIDYDKAGNVTEIRPPRYFDSSDPEYQNVKTTITYNGREMEASRTVAPGTSIAATTSKSYYLDGRSKTVTDAEGNDWTTYWHSCCGRFLGRKDPLGHGSFSNTDYEGRVTHTVSIEDYASHTNAHNPVDAKTYGETTTLFDELGRAIASTRWLTARGQIDPNDVPIAGLNSVSETLGLTDQTLYDSNLADGNGLDSTGGVTVNKLGGGTYTLSLSEVLDQLAETTANGGGDISFGTTSAGSAVVSINGEEEISVTVSDAAGRTVINAQLKPHSDANTGDLITWRCAQYDQTYNKTGFGDLVENCSIDALGNITKSRNDAAGRTLETVDAENNVSSNEYDASRNIVKARDPNDVGYDAVYDDLGRVTSHTDTYGDATSATYDDASNAITQTDAKNKSISTVYDAQGRRTSVTDRLNGDTEYTYDKNNNLLSITDAQNKLTSYEYDDRNAKVKETYPDHTGGNPGDASYGIIEFARDPAGRMLRRTDQSGDTVTLNYDLAGRLTGRDYRLKVNSPSGTIADSDTFTYDNNGRILTATSGRYNNVVTNTYDIAGRLASEEISNNGRAYTTSRSYDDRSILDKLTYHDNSVVDRIVDERGLLEELKLDSTNIASWQFDAGGRRTKQTYSSGVVTDYNYRDDANGKDNLVTSIDTTHPSGPTNQHVGDYDYTWDANKNKTSEVISGQLSGYGFNSGASPATYDDDDRLTGWNRTDGNKDQSWSLSLVGDWNSFTDESTTQNRTHNDAHELTAIDAQSLVYDVKGNLTTNSNGQKYTYDFDNRMSEIDVDGNGTADLKFRYDALGRRVMYWNGTKWYDYVVAGQQLLMVYQTNGTPQHKFIYGSYVDEPVMIVRTLNTTPTKYFYHGNQQFSVVALTDASTGLTKERYAYDAYGDTTILNYLGTSVKSQSDYSNPFMYTGRFTHPTTGLYYFRARWYDPKLGRFITRDPLGYIDGMSLYRGYFQLSAVDPSGLLSLNHQERLQDDGGPITSTKVFTKGCRSLARSPGNWTVTTTQQTGGGPGPRGTTTRYIDNLMTYTLSFPYECSSKGSTVTATIGRHTITSDLKGRLDSLGLSLYVVGATTTDWVEVNREAMSQEADCEDGETGAGVAVKFYLTWKTRGSVGINPGYGPFSVDLGWSFGKETVVAVTTATYHLTCCQCAGAPNGCFKRRFWMTKDDVDFLEPIGSLKSAEHHGIKFNRPDKKSGNGFDETKYCCQ